MATTATAPNPRASLLAGLRTGGVRSASTGVPHTAAPGGSFSIKPRFMSSQHIFPEEEDDQVAEIPGQNVSAFGRAMPMTAAVDGPNNRFSQQQRMNPGVVPFSPAFSGNSQAQAQVQVQAQAQALQMQMMQMEILRLQAMQAQQYQAELMAQAQRQQMQGNVRRASVGFNPPATAGPTTTAFDLRSAAANAQIRRGQNEHEDAVPMTAALGGKFGSRSLGMMDSASNNASITSGGTMLGNAVNTTPSKSDAASSWRRGGNNNSVLSGMNRPNPLSPAVRVTPPPADRSSPPSSENGDRASPPPAATASKIRPIPLRFGAATTQSMMPAVAVENGPTDSSTTANYSMDSGMADDGYSTVVSTAPGDARSGNVSPTTPRSTSSQDGPSLSPREEAAKKLYEGLGMGRPKPGRSTPPIAYRMASQPIRQPRGPPSGAEEIAPLNFANRLRKKALGGVGAALLSARERRETSETL